MENLFAMKNMKGKFPPLFPSLLFYFHARSDSGSRDRVLAGILKIMQVNQAMERIKIQLLHFPQKFSESSNNVNEGK
jgi:hypothetical protein